MKIMDVCLNNYIKIKKAENIKLPFYVPIELKLSKLFSKNNFNIKNSKKDPFLKA